MACIGVKRSYQPDFFSRILEENNYEYTIWFFDEDKKCDRLYKTIKSFIISRLSKWWMFEFKERQQGMSPSLNVKHLTGYSDNRRIIRIGLRSLMKTSEERKVIKHRVSSISLLLQTNLNNDCIRYILSFL